MSAISIEMKEGLGIVLGAGGPFGWAYHLGVVEGVQEALGIKFADIDSVVGTSAGAGVAASLLAGSQHAEILRKTSEHPSPDEKSQMMAALVSLFRRPWKIFTPQAPMMLWRGGLVGLAGLAPAGILPPVPAHRFPIGNLDGWPPQLWIPSLELGSGKTVVFGRDMPGSSVLDALEAALAVPCTFKPKQINGKKYIDGVVASATHADLLAPKDLKTIIVSSPMSRPGPSWVRSRARRQLNKEVVLLENQGFKVVVISPDAGFAKIAKGYPRRNPRAGEAIAKAARVQAIDLLRSQDLS